MAVRTDLTVDWTVSPRIIEVASPSVEITIQDLVDTLRDLEDNWTNLSYDQIVSAAGKEELGGGVLVGITATLLNALLQFEARTGPTYTQCRVSGGNLVAVDDAGVTQDSPIQPTAFTQVVVTASSSATLSDLAAIQYSSYGGGVSLDIDSSNSGTSYPTGNQEYPVNNLADAVAIANANGFRTLFVRSSMTGANKLNSGTDVSNFTIQGQSRSTTTIEVDTSADTTGATFINCTIYGTLDGTNTVQFCDVGVLNYFNGTIEQCGLFGTISLDGGAEATMNHCYTIDQDSPPTIDMGGTGQDLAMPNYSGIVTITNMTSATEEIGIGLSAGYVILDSTITAGNIVISGVGLLANNSTSVTSLNTDGLVNSESIGDAVWDDIHVHTTPGTKGYELYLAKKKAAEAADLSA